jgi:hypothetical protein
VKCMSAGPRKAAAKPKAKPKAKTAQRDLVFKADPWAGEGKGWVLLGHTVVGGYEVFPTEKRVRFGLWGQTYALALTNDWQERARAFVARAKVKPSN